MNFRSIVNDICCDSRIKDGVLRLENPDHVFIVQEYLEKAGYALNEIVDKTANLFEAGRFPDRQAYNKDGILVTFPSKEYRDRAVNKGTHFAENPKKAQANIFSAPGDLSSVGATEEKPKEKPDTISVDKEVQKGVEADDRVDNRTPKEKQQDAVANIAILQGQTPLVNYSVDEAIKYGFYKKGMIWFNTEGQLIGEQVFDEYTKSPIIQSIIKENAEDIEDAIVNALYNRGYPYDKDIENVAKKVANSIKPIVGQLKNAQRVGRETANLSEFWRSYNATDNTPKTDVIINDFKSSVKYGPSQLMSGGKNESLATFMAAVDSTPSVDAEIIKNATGMLNNFVSVTRTVEGGVEDLLRKKPSDIKSELEKKVKIIADAGDKAHKDLMLYLDTVFSQNQAFKHSFVREAMTGEHKFSNGSFAIANYILSVSKNGESIYFNQINDTVVNSVANSTKVSVRFKSTSVKKKGEKTGEYNFWSVVGLIVKDYKEKYTKINELLNSGDVLTEGIVDQVKLFLQNVWKFITDIYEKIITYIKQGFEYVIDFFGVDLQNEDIFVNGIAGGNNINIDFSKILNDNTPVSE
jgi:hypothetical protein